jgi:hypothetical protein
MPHIERQTSGGSGEALKVMCTNDVQDMKQKLRQEYVGFGGSPNEVPVLRLSS